MIKSITISTREEQIPAISELTGLEQGDIIVTIIPDSFLSLDLVRFLETEEEKATYEKHVTVADLKYKRISDNVVIDRMLDLNLTEDEVQMRQFCKKDDVTASPSNGSSQNAATLAELLQMLGGCKQ